MVASPLSQHQYRHSESDVSGYSDLLLLIMENMKSVEHPSDCGSLEFPCRVSSGASFTFDLIC